MGSEELAVRIHHADREATLVYLPGIHGDWTLLSSFRTALAGRVRFVEFTYPRTVDGGLADYAAEVTAALQRHGINRGWLLGESFGSQVVWPLCAMHGAAGPPPGPTPLERFRIQGVILAGGFVQYPILWGVRLCRAWTEAMPWRWMIGALGVYGWWARYRHGNAPETLAGVGEFLERRTCEADRRAIVHRLELILHSDPRRIAAQVKMPVFALVGLVDPVVPWWPVKRWLRRHCPGYRGSRLVWAADHNVLGTAPRVAADQICRWIESAAKRD